MGFRVRALVLAAALVAVPAGLAAADVGPGRIGPALRVTANGRHLHPIGRLTQVGDFPTGSALTRDGRFLWVVDSGHAKDDVRVVSVASGQVVQTLPLPGAYEGIAFAPDGNRAYVSGTPKGDEQPEGPVKGAQGDVVHVFAVDRATGRGTELDPISLPSSSGGSGRTNALPPVSGTGTAVPEGLAVSPNGRYLVVAMNNADRAAVVDLQSGGATLVTTGAYPAMVAFDHRGRAFVSNEYDGTLTVVDPASARVVGTVSGLGGKNSHPEGMATDPTRNAVYVAVANRDAVATVDADRLAVTRTVSLRRPAGIGTAPVNVAVDPEGRTLYAADSGEDAVAAVSLTRRPGPGAQVIPHRVVRVRGLASLRLYVRALHRANVALRGHPRQLRRKRAALRRRYLVGPTALACRGPSRKQERAYDNAVLRALRIHRKRARNRALARARRRLPRVVACPAAPGYIPNLPAGTVIGRIPTAAYTSSVQVTPDGSQLLWIAGKGFGAGPNPAYFFGGDKRPMRTPKNVYGTYVPDMLLGTTGVLPIPSDRQSRDATALADAALRTSDSEGTAPRGSPVVGPDGGPSRQIKHVFYIVKENRTYDQLFGSDRRGDGDPALELFDDNGVAGPTGGITPNAHALARKFPLLDHFYADSEVSVDGHVITSGSYAIDYVQKALANNYSSRGKGLDMGVYPVTFPPNDFIFDQAVRQGISFRNYGEQAAGNSPFGNDGRSTYSTVAANTDNSYPNNVFIGCLYNPSGPGAGTATNRVACTQDSGVVGGRGSIFGSQSRVNAFQQDFDREIVAGSVPTLNYMILPNDHTNGTTTNAYSPQAMIADNDLALGQIVELISHSPIWSSSAIVVVEDDSQDGADHVDAHRMPAYVISPWAKRGAVVHP